VMHVQVSLVCICLWGVLPSQGLPHSFLKDQAPSFTVDQLARGQDAIKNGEEGKVKGWKGKGEGYWRELETGSLEG
jgi:hypothetical protein